MLKRLPLMILGTVLAAPQVMAQDAPPAAAVCVSCHGQSGLGQPNIAPMLAGLNADYMSQQIDLFLSGKRNDPVMTAMAAPLADRATRKQVLDYFSKMPAPEVAEPEYRGDRISFESEAEKLVYQGDWSRNIPACSTCHGASGIGVDHIPRLAGQQEYYLAKQLQGWKQGLRTGDPINMMGHIAGQLTESEITGLASYFSSVSSGVKK
ncbi:c-type cytochrome [Oceanospirillum sp. HFRX-1_2]